VDEPASEDASDTHAKASELAAEDAGGADQEGMRNATGGEETTPRPGVTSTSAKHPTLALMAEIAARGGATEPGAAAPVRVSARDTGELHELAKRAGQAAASAEAETPARRALGAETHPLRAVRRAPAEPTMTERSQGASLAELPASASLSARRGHLPFPAPDLVVVTTGGHAALAALAALIGAGLMLQGARAALTLLAFAALAGCSGGLAYLLAQQPETRRAAGLTLIGAQVGMLAWAMALIGPHAALLVLAPALAVLAARMVSWRAAVGQSVAILVAYLLFVWMDLAVGFTPLLAPRGAGAEVLDAVVVVAGVLLAVAALQSLSAGRERALASARAREHEARVLRVTLTRERQRTEAEADALHQALAAGLRRRPSAPVRAEGPLGLLATTINRALERLAPLHEDREERRRLEGALGQLTRALERSWLGLPWSWPEASGTPVDAVVSLLRAPRPQDVPASTWPEDAPTLISLPTLGQLREQTAAQSSTLGSTPELPALATHESGWAARRRTSRLAEVAPPETGISSPRWSIHEMGEEGSGEREAETPTADVGRSGD
jgi:hypothetical protein